MNREIESINRHEIAFRGEEAFKKRADFRLVICGAGALGSNLLNILARQGFNSIILIDRDKVESHNTANQFYGKSDVGAAKVRACATKIFRETGIHIVPEHKELNKSNVKKFFKNVDLVVDTFDNFESRKIVKEAVASFNLACIHAGMSDDGFSEIKWSSTYHIPEVEVKQEDVCEYPLAVNLVHFTVCLLAEVITRFVDSKEQFNIEFTLNDLKITHRKLN